LTVLLVAYPFASVGPDAVGGAEQVLSIIDEALVATGHRCVVLATEGSTCAGELVPIPRTARADDPAGVRAVHEHLRHTIERIAGEIQADLVHAHGLDFHAYLPAGDYPLLATLHLPLSHYPRRALVPARPRTWLNGVSASQMHSAPADMPRIPVIPNGVHLDRFQPATATRRRYAIAIGRICPEKGFEAAIEASRRARMPMILAGRVFPYEAHEAYFRERIAPELISGCRFVGPVGLQRKKRLVSRARCLLVTSHVAETSSLVAMEALACGVPVVAMRTGALPEIVDHGATGFIVDDVESMAGAIREVGRIDPRVCRQSAEDRFDARRMTSSYLDLYQQLVALRRDERRACWP
jgi:glycosyltransferase involved in cell wall biosynthesis